MTDQLSEAEKNRLFSLMAEERVEGALSVEDKKVKEKLLQRWFHQEQKK